MQQPCCMEDGGRPFECGLQDQPFNRPALRGDQLPGGERSGKGELDFEMLVRCRVNSVVAVEEHHRAKDGHHQHPEEVGGCRLADDYECGGLDDRDESRFQIHHIGEGFDLDRPDHSRRRIGDEKNVLGFDLRNAAQR